MYFNHLLARSQNYEKWLLASCLSISLHRKTQLPSDKFSWNLVFEYFLKICPKNSSFIKIWHEEKVFYLYTYADLWHYFAVFFLEWEMFQTKVVEKIKTHIFNNFFFPQNCAVNRIMWKKWQSWRGCKWQKGACALHAW
jgi:hypothetical protein